MKNKETVSYRDLPLIKCPLKLNSYIHCHLRLLIEDKIKEEEDSIKDWDEDTHYYQTVKKIISYWEDLLNQVNNADKSQMLKRQFKEKQKEYPNIIINEKIQTVLDKCIEDNGALRGGVLDDLTEDEVRSVINLVVPAGTTGKAIVMSGIMSKRERKKEEQDEQQ